MSGTVGFVKLAGTITMDQRDIVKNIYKRKLADDTKIK